MTLHEVQVTIVGGIRLPSTVWRELRMNQAERAKLRWIEEGHQSNWLIIIKKLQYQFISTVKKLYKCGINKSRVIMQTDFVIFPSNRVSPFIIEGEVDTDKNVFIFYTREIVIFTIPVLQSPFM